MVREGGGAMDVSGKRRGAAACSPALLVCEALLVSGAQRIR